MGICRDMRGCMQAPSQVTGAFDCIFSRINCTCIASLWLVDVLCMYAACMHLCRINSAWALEIPDLDSRHCSTPYRYIYSLYIWLYWWHSLTPKAWLLLAWSWSNGLPGSRAIPASWAACSMPFRRVEQLQARLGKDMRSPVDISQVVARVKPGGPRTPMPINWTGYKMASKNI